MKFNRMIHLLCVRFGGCVTVWVKPGSLFVFFVRVCVYLYPFGLVLCVWHFYKTSAMHPYISLQGWSISKCHGMCEWGHLHACISFKVPAFLPRHRYAHMCRVRVNRDGGLFWQSWEVNGFSVVKTVCKLRNLFWSTCVRTCTGASSRCMSTLDSVCYFIPS